MGLRAQATHHQVGDHEAHHAGAPHGGEAAHDEGGVEIEASEIPHARAGGHVGAEGAHEGAESLCGSPHTFFSPLCMAPRDKRCPN
jgi:hypothetical protein